MQYISSDSNIWFDFNRLQRIDWPFRLEYVFCMSSDAIRDELVSPPELSKQLIDLGLVPVDIDDAELALTVQYTLAYPKLSVYDSIALAIAKVRGYILLTGDGPLRSAARREDVEVHGTLWVFDQLLDSSKISQAEYLATMNHLLDDPQGRRLPVTEIKKRLDIHR